MASSYCLTSIGNKIAIADDYKTSMNGVFGRRSDFPHGYEEVGPNRVAYLLWAQGDSNP